MAIKEKGKFGHQMPTQNPFVICMHHLDKFPEGDGNMNPKEIKIENQGFNENGEWIGAPDKKYQELLETLSPEQEEVITEYCNAIFSSGAETEEFFYRLGLKDGLNLKNTVKLVLEMIS